MKSIFIIPFACLFILVSQAQEIEPGYWEKQTVEKLLEKAQVPEYLYHWTSQESLVGMADRNESPTHLPLKNRYGSILGAAGACPYEVLMTSSNPVAGMGTDLELYAKAKMEDTSRSASWLDRWKNRGTDKYLVTTTPARLMTIKPKKDATFHVIITRLRQDGGRARPHVAYIDKRGVEKPDLIYHLHVGGDVATPTHLQFQEWVIQNPNAIEWFSADPNAARKQIVTELAKFDNPNFEYKAEEKTISTEPLPKHFKRILSDFLEGGTKGIPEMFMSQDYKQQCSFVM